MSNWESVADYWVVQAPLSACICRQASNHIWLRPSPPRNVVLPIHPLTYQLCGGPWPRSSSVRGRSQHTWSEQALLAYLGTVIIPLPTQHRFCSCKMRLVKPPGLRRDLVCCSSGELLECLAHRCSADIRVLPLYRNNSKFGNHPFCCSHNLTGDM